MLRKAPRVFVVVDAVWKHFWQFVLISRHFLAFLALPEHFWSLIPMLSHVLSMFCCFLINWHPLTVSAVSACF